MNDFKYMFVLNYIKIYLCSFLLIEFFKYLFIRSDFLMRY